MHRRGVADPPEGTQVSIEVRGVNKKFGDFVALDNVSVSIPQGQLTALLGPSGGGKSTLLRIIAGLEFADSGIVEIEGLDATYLPPQKRNVGFVFQHYAAFKHMTVAKNVAFGIEIRKKPKAEVKSRVDELLALVHLSQFADRLPSQLSGGQRQRMALARALAVEPTVLLLDEPFGALDAQVRKELRDWLRRLHDTVHVTTVLVTHDQEEALEVADEIVVINNGRIEQIGTPDQLYDEPANDFVMSFLGPVTRLGGRMVRPHDLELFNADPGGAQIAAITRITRVGFEVRVDLAVGDEAVVVTMTRTHFLALGLRVGDPVWVATTEGAQTITTGRRKSDRVLPDETPFVSDTADAQIVESVDV
jgi:sulfate transport system ATP-binding protein